MAAMGLAASSPWIDAQTYRGLEPGANQNQNLPTSAADVRITATPSAGKSAASVMDPAEAAMLRSRSARTVLRNGLDYIKYQQYDKALNYLREAERRSKELGTQELISLRQGIESAQEGLRTPSIQVGYARTRKPMAGSVAIASSRSQAALTDPAMKTVSAEVPAEVSPELKQELKAAAIQVESADSLHKLEPIRADVLSTELPTAAELAKSNVIDSAHRKYAVAGNSGSSLPPVKAPSALSETTFEHASPATDAAVLADNQETAQTSDSDQAPSVLPPVLMRDLDSAAPAPLPGSPSAMSSSTNTIDGIPPLDQAVEIVNDNSQPLQPSAPQITEIKAPKHLDESSTLPELPVLSEVDLPKDQSVEPLSEPTTSAQEPVALPPLEPASKPLPELPALQPEEVSLPALPETQSIPQSADAEPIKEHEPAPVVPAPALPLVEPDSQTSVVDQTTSGLPELPRLESSNESIPALPELPLSEETNRASTETVQPTVMEKDLRTVSANQAEMPQPQEKQPLVQESVGGIPVLTPLPEGDDEPVVSTGSAKLPVTDQVKNVDSEPSLPPLPATPMMDETGLPPLPAVMHEEPASSPAPAEANQVMPETVEFSSSAQPEASLPPLPVGDLTPQAAEAMPPLPTESATASGEPGQVTTSESLPPLPVADTPPVPTATPEEKSVERIAQSGRELPSANLGDTLPPLPAEEIAGTGAAAPASVAGSRTSSEPLGISDRILSSLSPSSRRDIEQMARMQVERPGGATPGLSPLGNLPAAEPADIVNRSMFPSSVGSSSGALDDPLVRLELPRAPSPAEARPIRAILLPEQFDNIKNREFEPRRKMWASAAVAHYPLYFQNPTLERYGISFEQRLGPVGRKLTYPIDDQKESKQRNQIATPFFSAGLFAAQIATWPLRMVADPPWEAEYDLGYYRPGDRVPEDTVVIPWKGVGPLFKGNNY